METSPEPTVVVKALNDFDQFVRSGSKAREMFQDSARRLNFSRGDESSFLVSSSTGTSGVGLRQVGASSAAKRRLDSLVGFGESLIGFDSFK